MAFAIGLVLAEKICNLSVYSFQIDITIKIAQCGNFFDVLGITIIECIVIWTILFLLSLKCSLRYFQFLLCVILGLILSMQYHICVQFWNFAGFVVFLFCYLIGGALLLFTIMVAINITDRNFACTKYCSIKNMFCDYLVLFFLLGIYLIYRVLIIFICLRGLIALI
ncbi:MAG: hypothetical protein RR291_04100 [Clostridia bacterium]